MMRIRRAGLVAVLMAIVAVWVGIVLGAREPRASPEIVLRTTSRSVNFVLADSLNLVERARPYLGLVNDTLPFEGFSVTAASAGQLIQDRLGEHLPRTSFESPATVREFSVAAGCRIVLEPRGQRLLALSVQAQGDGAPLCDWRINLIVPMGNNRLMARDIYDTTRVLTPLRLDLSAPNGLALHGLSVSSVSFVSAESGKWQSTLLGGRLEYVRYPAHSITLLPGDSLVMGHLEQSEIRELQVAQTIESTLRGRARNPMVGERPLRPSRRDEIRSAAWFELLIGVLTMLTAIAFPIVDRLAPRPDRAAPSPQRPEFTKVSGTDSNETKPASTTGIVE